MSGEIGLLEHIQMIRGRLKPTLQAVADTVLSRPSQVSGMNIQGPRRRLRTSPRASISRFVREVGLPSFQGVPDPHGGGARGRPKKICHALKARSTRPSGVVTPPRRILTKVAHRNCRCRQGVLVDPRCCCARDGREADTAGASDLFLRGRPVGPWRLKTRSCAFSTASGKPAIFHSRSQQPACWRPAAIRPGAVADRDQAIQAARTRPSWP